MAEKQKQKELEVEKKLQQKKEELKSLDHSYDRWMKKDRLPSSDPSGEEKWRPGKGSWRLRVSERQELADSDSSTNETKSDIHSKPTSARSSTIDTPSSGIYKPPAARKENSRW
ncbi:hypothetical protein PMAC_000514 [Pneumocystis sp. 'macacae']|nr:hypothetical protein PMAC_000514 [Pneumocystis sp. 'macacae']